MRRCAAPFRRCCESILIGDEPSHETVISGLAPPRESSHPVQVNYANVVTRMLSKHRLAYRIGCPPLGLAGDPAPNRFTATEGNRCDLSLRTARNFAQREIRNSRKYRRENRSPNRTLSRSRVARSVVKLKLRNFWHHRASRYVGGAECTRGKDAVTHARRVIETSNR